MCIFGMFICEIEDFGDILDNYDTTAVDFDDCVVKTTWLKIQHGGRCYKMAAMLVA